MKTNVWAGVRLAVLVSVMALIYVRIAIPPWIDWASASLLTPWYVSTARIGRLADQGIQLWSQYYTWAQAYSHIQGAYNTLLAEYMAIQEERYRLAAITGIPVHPELARSDARVLARIVLMVRTGSQEVYMLDRGSCDGVRVGSLLLIDGILAGLVVQVAPRSCRVMGVRDTRSEIPVCAVGSSYTGVAVGKGSDDAVHIMYVPHTAAPHVADVVVCSGHGSRFPAGLAVARITEVTCCPGDVMYEMRAEPLIVPRVGQVGMLVAPLSQEPTV